MNYIQWVVICQEELLKAAFTLLCILPVYVQGKDAVLIHEQGAATPARRWSVRHLPEERRAGAVPPCHLPRILKTVIKSGNAVIGAVFATAFLL